MWKEKKGKDGKTYYYNVITRKIHPYLRGGGLTFSRRLVVPNEEPELLEEAESELASLICKISETLIVDQPVSIDSIKDVDPSLNPVIKDLTGTDRNPLIYSESAIRDWFTRLQAYGGNSFIFPDRSVLILTPQPDRIRDTSTFVERIIHTRYKGSGWDQLRIQCAGYLELIRENDLALVAQEDAHIYETARIEREKASANALGDDAAIAFAIEEQEIRDAQLIALEGAREGHEIANVLESEIALDRDRELRASPPPREECPKYQVRDPNVSASCSICLEDMEDIVSLLECGHYFNQDCIRSVINNARSEYMVPVCPNCRDPIRIIPPRLAAAPLRKIRRPS
jgi:hypothetical protein